MNKLIEKQLEKCKVAIVPPYSDDTTQIYIKRFTGVKQPASNDLIENSSYTIIVEDYIIHPFEGFNLHDNWNNGVVPTDRKMSVTIERITGNMIKVNAVGCNDKLTWNGWLPRKSIHILED